MIRRLLWIALAALVAWALRSTLAGRKRTRRAAGRSARSDGQMVRDRVCNTFLPESRALKFNDGGTAHYFCSERCRATYLEGRRAAS